MEPKIIESTELILVGMDFFGDPCAMASPWSEENEIGQLWKRFMQFMARKASAVKHQASPSVGFEVHIMTDETESTGHRQIFVGIEVSELEELPLELVVKLLPPTKYAVFTFKGAEITSDWGRLIYHDWLPQSGFKSHYDYLIERYDERFKGLEGKELEESELDVLVPII
jgi:AraC family transcriptional regulator